VLRSATLNHAEQRKRPSKSCAAHNRTQHIVAEVCEAGSRAGCLSSAGWSLGSPVHVCAGDLAVTSDAITLMTQNVAQAAEGVTGWR
jgi:hypothetical protein